jgi:hypothetical protein
MTSRLATPLDVAVPPEFYFDAAQTATYTLDGDGKVQSRRDVSGKGVVAQADADKRPVPIAAGSAGFPLPALSYKGAIEFVPVRITGTTLTAFLVARIFSNGGGYDRVISYGQPGGYDFNEPGSFDVELHPWDPAIRLQRNGGIEKSFALTQPVVIEVVFDGSVGRLFLGGQLWVTIGCPWPFDIAIAAIGGSIMNSHFLRSVQGAQLVYADALSDADRALVRGALSWKWDGGAAGPLVAQLPADDPYKLAPPTIATGAPAAAPRRRRPLLVTG